MNRTRYLLGNINLANALLAGVLFFLVNYMLLPFLHKSFQYSLPAIAGHEQIGSGGIKNQDSAKPPSPSDYTIIGEQNLFHSERKIPEEKKEQQATPRPDFILYGTLVSDDLNLAFMDDLRSPQSTPGRGKRQHTVPLGKIFSGYTLAEVSTDRVVMVKGDDRIEIVVNDPSKPKRVPEAKPGSAPKVPEQATNGQKSHVKIQTSSESASSAEKRALKEQKKRERQTKRAPSE